MKLHVLVVVLLLASCTQSADYNPAIDPADFSTEITNPYFALPVGRTLTYDGSERVQIVVKEETRTVMGVATRIYWDRVWEDGELVEDTRDYLAQDSAGNVWYFGEDVDNYEDGEIKDHDGAWMAGVNGAKPGIWMKADPQIGDTYRQEYSAGEAEDMGEVVSRSETVTVPAGTFTNCLKTREWTPLEPGVTEYKYHCPEISALVLETDADGGERVELVSITG